MYPNSGDINYNKHFSCMEPDFHAFYFPRPQKEIATWLLTKATNLASCRKCYDLIKGRFMKLCWCSSTERNYIKVRFQIKASLAWGKLQMACRGGVYKSVSTFSCLLVTRVATVSLNVWFGSFTPDVLPDTIAKGNFCLQLETNQWLFTCQASV